MNKWQKIFLMFGIIAIVLLLALPPQITLNKTVRYLPFTYDYPIDWLKLFLWILGIVFVTGLGIAANKGDHF